MPVLAGIKNIKPEERILFVTDHKYLPYFKDIKGIEPFGYDAVGRHRGILGLIRLFNDLRPFRITKVIDLHGVIRTYFLDALFLLGFTPVKTVRKHRKLRKQVLKGTGNLEVPHAVERYQEVLERAKMEVQVVDCPLKRITPAAGQGIPRIGFAPLARHNPKNWSRNHILRFLGNLKPGSEHEVYLFGGKEDSPTLDALTGKGIHNVAGNLSPDEEIALISTMDVFVSMDSANMHLASLCGIPTISIWGATDPKLGFRAYNQPERYSFYASRENVNCRPCSVYGGKPCYRKDSPMLCMDKVDPNQVTEMLKEIIELRSL
jgi:ADP-heptose:LPS heptosyltransferase